LTPETEADSEVTAEAAATTIAVAAVAATMTIDHIREMIFVTAATAVGRASAAAEAAAIGTAAELADLMASITVAAGKDLRPIRAIREVIVGRVAPEVEAGRRKDARKELMIGLFLSLGTKGLNWSCSVADTGTRESILIGTRIFRSKLPVTTVLEASKNSVRS